MDLMQKFKSTVDYKYRVLCRLCTVMVPYVRIIQETCNNIALNTRKELRWAECHCVGVSAGMAWLGQLWDRPGSGLALPQPSAFVTNSWEQLIWLTTNCPFGREGFLRAKPEISTSSWAGAAPHSRPDPRVPHQPCWGALQPQRGAGLLLASAGSCQGFSAWCWTWLHQVK